LTLEFFNIKKFFTQIKWISTVNPFNLRFYSAEISVKRTFSLSLMDFITNGFY